MAVLFTLYTPVYSTITAVCTIFLYSSYVLPTLLGARTYRRSWNTIGPWNLGNWYQPLAVLSVIGCLVVIFIGIQPPNQQSVRVLGGVTVTLIIGWFAYANFGFPARRSVCLIDPSEIERPLMAARIRARNPRHAGNNTVENDADAGDHEPDAERSNQ